MTNINFAALATATLSMLDSSTGRLIADASISKGTIGKWVSVNSLEQVTADVSLILTNQDFNEKQVATLRLMEEADSNEEGEATTLAYMGTLLFMVGQDGAIKSKVIGTASDEDVVNTSELDEDHFIARLIRVLPDGKTVKREVYDQPIRFSLAVGYEAAMQAMVKEVTDRMKKARKATAIEFELAYLGTVIGSGSSIGTLNASEFNEMEIKQDVAAGLEFTTTRHRRDVMDLMSGMSVREFVRDINGENIRPTSLMSFEQEGVYAKVKTLVIVDVKEYKAGREIGMQRKLISRTMYEPAVGLSDFTEEFTSIFIGSDVFQSLEEDQYEDLVEWVKGRMSKSAFPHFIVGRKKRLIFGRKPFGETEITRDFTTVNVNRAEHLGQLVTARGIACEGEIDTPELVDYKVPDGVVMAINHKQGARLGLTEGVWQNRSVNPYSKGTIVVSRLIKRPFLNMDAIKVKPTVWPSKIRGSDIIVIANSDSSYSMGMSHQFGYLFVDKFLEAKGKIKPWGKIPELMALNVTEKKVKATLPSEYARLQSYGLPYEYFREPEGLQEVLTRAMRPKVAELTMFVALPIEHLDRNHFDKVGMYMPATTDEDQEGRYWMRVPALAVGGGAQDLHTKDEHGDIILCDKDSGMLNVTVAAIHEPAVIGKDDDGEILQFPDDVELGGAGRSRIIWEMMAALGADSDGDRTARTYKSIDPFLERAGLSTPRDVPMYKTKLAYKGIDTWSEKDRIKLWAVSTPKLASVGIGDVMTQRCVDMVFEGHMNATTWRYQSRAGAELTQSGVSAPKYDTILREKRLLTDLQVNKKMRETGTGDGYKSQGLLFQPTIDAIQGYLRQYFPESAQYRSVTVTHPERRWEGGMIGFHTRLMTFDEQMGDYWVNMVKDSFKQELARMVTYGITDETARREKLAQFGKNFKAGHARKMVRGYVAAYINANPDKPHIWAWLLDPEFIRPSNADRRPDGMILTAPNLNQDNTGQILEIMGMPFNIEALRERAAILAEKEEERKEKRRK